MHNRLAVIALVAVGLLGALAHALSQQPRTFRARFASGENLAVGAPLRAQGNAIGTVAGITTDAAGSALVEFELQREAPQVPADSVAILAPGGIDLILGDATEPAGPDTVLKGYRTLTEFRMASARGGVDRLLDQLQNDAETLGKTLQEKGAQAGEVLRRELERLRKELQDALPEPSEAEPPSRSI